LKQRRSCERFVEKGADAKWQKERHEQPRLKERKTRFVVVEAEEDELSEMEMEEMESAGQGI